MNQDIDKTDSAGIDMKSLDGFNRYTFFIPSQQRGYRWRVRNVLELVEDLLDFKKSESNVYCMQPLAVVKEDKNRFQVLDGQQRLTTLYLLILALGGTPGYQFEFERDKGSKRSKLLENIRGLSEIDESTIDNYHITKAYTILDALFNHKDTNDKENKMFYNRLRENLNEENKNWLRWLLLHDEKSIPAGNEEIKWRSKTLQFIWYETTGDPHKVFRNLNSGKIELGNADLIKALLLSESSGIDKKRRMIIALQFERIMFQMRDDRFWHMLQRCEYERRGYTMSPVKPIDGTNKVMLQNRIDLIFNIAMGVSLGKYQGDALASFRAFYDKREELDRQWTKTYQLFLKLVGLYNDPYTYHYAGFLTYCQGTASYENIINWLSLLDTHTKSEVISGFRKQIYNDYLPKYEGEKELRLPGYSDGTTVRRVLLLHNIESVLVHYTQKKDSCKLHLETIYEHFPFDLLYRQKWDIEHIASQSDADMRKKEDQKVWVECLNADYPDLLDDTKPYDKGLYGFSKEQVVDIREKHKAYKDFEDFESFKTLYKCVIEASEHSGEKIDDKDRIGNLCLLDHHTNRSYHNSLFPSKRRILIEADGGGEENLGTELTFVPMCTRRVFTKYYNSRPGVSMAAWTKADAEAYENDIIKKLEVFFKAQQNGTEQEN